MPKFAAFLLKTLYVILCMRSVFSLARILQPTCGDKFFQWIHVMLFRFFLEIHIIKFNTFILFLVPKKKQQKI